MRERQLSYDFPIGEYMDLLTAEYNELQERGAKAERTMELYEATELLKQEIQCYRTHILPEAARRQGNTIPEEAAPTTSTNINRVPPPQLNPVMEEEEESEPEEEEEEEEEWSDAESEAPPPYRGPLSDEKIEAMRAKYGNIVAPDIEITDEDVRSFLRDVARRIGVRTLEEFNALDWENILFGEEDDVEEDDVEPAIVDVIDPYNDVPKTELVRVGDIIEVRFVDPLKSDKIIKFHSSEHLIEPEVIITTEAPSPDIIEDVAHHTELTETFIDAACDELFIKTGEDTAEEFSEEEKASVSIDANASVDRHREDNKLDEFSQEKESKTPMSSNVGKSVDRQQEDTCPNELSLQPLVQNEFIEFLFPPESPQYPQDIPVLEESSEDDAWSYVRPLSRIVVFIKNCAKRLSAQIDRRRTKGALALPFDSLH